MRVIGGFAQMFSCLGWFGLFVILEFRAIIGLKCRYGLIVVYKPSLELNRRNGII